MPCGTKRTEPETSSWSQGSVSLQTLNQTATKDPGAPFTYPAVTCRPSVRVLSTAGSGDVSTGLYVVKKLRFLLLKSGGHSTGITAEALVENRVQGYLASMSVSGAARWGKLSESWPKSNSPPSTLCHSTLKGKLILREDHEDREGE